MLLMNYLLELVFDSIIYLPWVHALHKRWWRTMWPQRPMRRGPMRRTMWTHRTMRGHGRMHAWRRAMGTKVRWSWWTHELMMWRWTWWTPWHWTHVGWRSRPHHARWWRAVGPKRKG